MLVSFFTLSISQITQDRLFYQVKNIDECWDSIVKNNLVEYRINELLDNILNKGIEDNELDFLSWITIGNLMAQFGQSEFSMQCYYMAHLLEPNILGANSELKLDPSEIKDSWYEENTDLEENIKNSLFDKLSE